MESLKFDQPVLIRRFGQMAEVRTLGEALSLLKGWPAMHRTALFRAAQDSCEAAVEHLVTVAEAREALAEFAAISAPAARPQMQGAGSGKTAGPSFLC